MTMVYCLNRVECRCHKEGSASEQCDVETGQCQCKERFIGKHCDRCKVRLDSSNNRPAIFKQGSHVDNVHAFNSHFGCDDCRKIVLFLFSRSFNGRPDLWLTENFYRSTIKHGRKLIFIFLFLGRLWRY